MINKLDYYVVFTIAGKLVEFKNSITFDKGMTAILGPNGKGKSLTIEMAQFCLFGTKALRGKTSDYQKLAATLEFEVKGSKYKVDRTLSNATLFRGDIPLATGTTPVNQAIAALFGYSYDVFLVANVANQGSIEKLGNMRPTERKQLVDETIGLNVLDDLEKFISESLKTLNGEVSGMEAAMSLPVAPVKPDGYAPSGSLAADLESLRSTNMERIFLLQASQKALPQWLGYPEECAYPVAKLSEYEGRQALKNSLTTELGVLQREYQKIPEAKYSSEQLDLWWDQWKLIDDHKVKSQLKTKLEKEKVRHECPKCQHEWFDQDPRLADIVVPVIDFDNPPVPTNEIVVHQRAIPQQDRKQELKREMEQLQERIDGIPDHSKEISAIKSYTLACERAAREKEAYDKAKGEREAAASALLLEKYAGIEERLTATEVQYRASITYEALQSAYEKQKETYDKLVVDLAQKKEEADSWKKAKAAVANLRARVKGYLLPSLNSVASGLIHQMTGGELDWIVVNEEFEITVAGQRLETLSGSGKAVANLALRIALGQVLTNKVFSVMMLDEIDASCDDKRAKYIAECVRRLTSTISQVVLISHKAGVEADNYVRL